MTTTVCDPAVTPSNITCSAAVCTPDSRLARASTQCAPASLLPSGDAVQAPSRSSARRQSPSESSPVTWASAIQALETGLGDLASCAMPIRLLSVATRYARTKDTRVLLELPLEERTLLTEAESLPSHVLVGPDIMSRWLTSCHPRLRRGDAFLHNSPHHGNSHAADHTILVPVIDDDGVHRFTVFAKAHQADIGNSQPTSYTGAARDVYEEGALIFPHTKLRDSGCLPAAVARAVVASGRETVLAIGVLHGGREVDADGFIDMRS